MAKRTGLTPKQARFVEEYLIDLNATQAAIRAGYSARTAAWIGSQLLEKTHISDAVQAAQQVRSERTEVTQDDVIKGLRIEAQGKGPDTTSSARLGAWKALGEHLGMFTKKGDFTVRTKRDAHSYTDEELIAIISGDSSGAGLGEETGETGPA